jgi:hypothetical protein
MSAEAFPLRDAPRGRTAARHGGSHRRARAAKQSVVRQTVHRAISVGLLGLAVLAAFQEERGRDFEAWLASHTFHLLGVQTGYFGGSLAMAWFAMNPHLHIGFMVTTECTIAFLLIPFLIATSLLIWQRIMLVRPLIGLAVATAMLIGMNQLRLLQIAEFVKGMGLSSGFYWGHTIVGSVITIVGLAVSLIVFAMIAVRWRDSGQH